MNERPELFLLSWGVIDACGWDEINATYEDMKKIGIDHLPYRFTDVAIPACINGDQAKRNEPTIDFGRPMSTGPYSNFNCSVKFRFEDEHCYEIWVKMDGDPDWIRVHGATAADKEHAGVCTCPSCERPWLKSAAAITSSEKFKKVLVVLLATKDIAKTRTKDKLLAMGIGKHKKDNHHPIYTTTISLPLQFTPATGTNHPPVDKTGRKLRPHLRRGHVTHQRHGPRNQYVKMIWIQPCFVNKDEHYVPQRINYNVSMKCEGIEHEENKRCI